VFGEIASMHLNVRKPVEVSNIELCIISALKIIPFESLRLMMPGVTIISAIESGEFIKPKSEA